MHFPNAASKASSSPSKRARLGFVWQVMPKLSPLAKMTAESEMGGGRGDGNAVGDGDGQVNNVGACMCVDGWTNMWCYAMRTMWGDKKPAATCDVCPCTAMCAHGGLCMWQVSTQASAHAKF
eukprot:6408473-Alexandrium_andersonii.AAC.1